MTGESMKSLDFKTNFLSLSLCFDISELTSYDFKGREKYVCVGKVVRLPQDQKAYTKTMNV